MTTRLFVGGLPWSTTSDDLSSLFSQAGTVVSATVVTDRMTGRSRGFGFVEMGSEEEAQFAVQRFNNSEVGGRKIIVNEARPQADRQDRYKDGDRGNRHGFRRENRRNDRRKDY
ncbi:MAG: RNA-binding protein [Patescibacteria group bacterium]|nr:RNA-binding protein [Patescibacteria group bacterium]